MIGQSQGFVKLLEQVERVARCDATVLVEGETGTGKELVARAIHYQGARQERPFVPVNCGALPDSLLENELFGHAKGAFTDARSDQPGLVGLAEGGTLFLDEVDALTPRAQVALLRFLQDQRYRPLGSRQERDADVRVIAASNQCLEQLVKADRFRLDLLYRLRLLHLRIPPLRERPGDPALLCTHFIEKAQRKFGGRARALDAATIAWLDLHSWPGNVRELENLVYQAHLACDDEVLSLPPPDTLAATSDQDTNTFTYRCAKEQAIAAFETRFLGNAMQRSSGNVSAAARLIGTERRHLGRLLKKYSIQY